MIREDILKQVLIEQKDLLELSPDYVDREIISEVSSMAALKHIITITGHRRAGKSVFLSQIIHKFYRRDDVYYLNLDDERLTTLDIQDLNRVIEMFIRLFGKKRVIFLDEIQNIGGWERFVSRLYNEGYKIYITGSNARLLSSELATLLTGRYLDIEIYPFSFREFLSYKNINVNEEMLYKTEGRAELLNQFDSYLISGGFPEIVQYNEMKILRKLFSDVITKDVIRRYNVRNVKTIEEIAMFLLSNSAKEISYNRIKNIYGLGSVHTAKNYVKYLESSFMFFELPRFSHSLKEMHRKIRKVYVIDNGFIESVGFSSSMDTGRLYENLVFVELRRRQEDFYYYRDKSGKEVDFVIRDGRKVKECIQVSYEVEEERTFKRETGNLLKVMDEFKLRKGNLITGHKEDKIEISGKTIEFIPLWKWLLA
jgi:hypothetical protein